MVPDHQVPNKLIFVFCSYERTKKVQKPVCQLNMWGLKLQLYFPLKRYKRLLYLLLSLEFFGILNTITANFLFSLRTTLNEVSEN